LTEFGISAGPHPTDQYRSVAPLRRAFAEVCHSAFDQFETLEQVAIIAKSEPDLADAPVIGK